MQFFPHACGTRFHNSHFFNACILVTDNEDLCQQTNIIAVYYADHILLNDVRRGETSFEKQPLLSNAKSNIPIEFLFYLLSCSMCTEQ